MVSSVHKVDGDVVALKVAKRVIPLVVLGYFVAYLNRTNLAMASLTMSEDLSFTATVIGQGAGIFFLGYVLFEVPSNLALTRFGARIWLARIMLTWGIISIGMACVYSPVSFYIMRFLLGAAEAGFVPGVVFLLVGLFPAKYRTRMFGLFIAANPLSGMIGSPLSGLIMRLDGFHELHGWQWVFILEGVPAILLAVAFFLYLPERHEQVDSLTEAEREWLRTTLADESKEAPMIRADHLGELLLNSKVWLLAIAYLGVASASYGVAFWLPLVIDQFGFDVLTIGMLASIPWLFATVGTIYWTFRSDRTGKPVMHLVVACITGFGGLALAAHSSTPLVSLIGLTAAAVGVLSAIATFWALPAGLLRGRSLAVAIAFINSIGSLGGFVGPYLMGWFKDATQSFATGLMFLAGGALIAALIAMLFRGLDKTSKDLTSRRLRASEND